MPTHSLIDRALGRSKPRWSIFHDHAESFEQRGQLYPLLSVLQPGGVVFMTAGLLPSIGRLAVGAGRGGAAGGDNQPLQKRVKPRDDS